MLAKLDSFAFVMDQSHFKQLEETFTYHFAEHKQLGHDSTFHDVNGRSHRVTLRGLLVQRPMATIDPLIAIADRKKPVRLTTKTDDYYVLIRNIRRGKDRYNHDGSYMVQSFDITLERVSGGGGFGLGLSLIGAIAGAIL